MEPSRFICNAGRHGPGPRKRHLPGVSQDGDEGILRLDRLPTSEEAELIRHYVGLHQT
jgi:hypothetical protein